jgi:hypothetical protein
MNEKITIGSELNIPWPLKWNLRRAASIPFARFGFTSLSKKHVKIIVRMIYMLIRKLNMEENLRELKFRGRDRGKTSAYYTYEYQLFITEKMIDQKILPLCDSYYQKRGRSAPIRISKVKGINSLN